MSEECPGCKVKIVHHRVPGCPLCGHALPDPYTENASLRARVSEREDRVKVLEGALDFLLRAKDPNLVSNDPAVINGWRALSPAVPVTPERKEKP